MTQLLLQFFIVVTIQLLLFLMQARQSGQWGNVPRYLKQGMLLGLPFGIAFDLLVGKFIGVYGYEIGFLWWFLVINGLFSFGFMIANVLLLKDTPPLRIYAWAVMIAVAYEIANRLYPVWYWNINENPIITYGIVLFVLYGLITWLILLTLRLPEKLSTWR